MWAWRALLVIGLFLMITYPVRSQCCDSQNMEMKLRAPDGVTESDWYPMGTRSTKGGTCEVSPDIIYEWSYFPDWCAEGEGFYDVKVQASSAVDGDYCDIYQWEESNWYEDLYELDYDARQEWCECGGYTWSSKYSCCFGDDATDTCSEDSQCSGTCTSACECVACVDDSDCNAGEECEYGACVQVYWGESSDGSQKDCCEVNDVDIQIRAPDGTQSAWFDTIFSSESGTCGSTPEKFENFNNSFDPYTFCPGGQEGGYDVRMRASVDYLDGSACQSTDWEYTGWAEGVYQVNYDSSQEWCECLMGPGFWAPGGVDCDPDTTGIQTDCCCGDDPSVEKAGECLDGGEGYCIRSSDNYACCDDEADCVFDNVCYDNDYEDGSWKCLSGIWHDYIEPATTDNSSAGWSASDQSIELQCDDLADGSGCDKARYCIGSDSCTPPGADYDISSGIIMVDVQCSSGSVCQQYVRYYSTDIAGNQESLKTSSQINIDKQAPVTSPDITGTAGNDGWYRSQVNVDLVCDDVSGAGCDPSGTMYCTYQQPDTGCTPDQVYSGTITLTDEGTTTIVYYSSDTLGNTESPKSTAIKIDRQDPEPWVEDLPAYVNETQGAGAEFDVFWDGIDPPPGSGIESFDIQYMIFDRASQAEEQAWTDWLTGTTSVSEVFGPNSPIQVNTHNNDTIFFRIRARDRAGNVFEYAGNPGPYKNVTVDVQAPSCTVEDIPDFQASGDFSVTFYLTEGESLLGDFNGEIRVDSGSWTNMDGYADCWLSGSGSNYQTYTCSGLEEATYDFRGRGKDVAGNLGDWSPTETTTVDLSAPVVILEQPDFAWTSSESFSLHWSTEDPDIDQYQISYQEADWPGTPAPGGWQAWNTYPGTATSDTFGSSGSPAVNLLEGRTYFINISASDVSGHVVYNVTNVTIDRTAPSAGHFSRDQNGNPLGSDFIPPGADVTLINITATSSDSLSGISSSRIEYSVYNDTFTQGDIECGEGPEQGSVVCSSADSGIGRLLVGYNEETLLRFRVVAEDRAGNSFASSYGVFTSHPLARFGTSNYHISLGESNILPVVITNILDQPDNITINLTGYPHAEFEIECSPTDCELAPDRRSIKAFDVYTYEQRVYYIRVLSSDPGLYIINMTAQSELDVHLNDTHSTDIRITFPAFFPGLGGWAIALLLVLSGFIYALAGDRLSGRA